MSVNESLQRLRAIRGGHRSTTTKSINEITGILGDGTGSLSNESLTHLNILKQQLDGKQRTLNELDTKILNEIKIEEIEKEIEDNEAVVIRITEAKEKIEQAIRANSANRHEVSNTSGNDGAANSTSTRLPKLQLTHFKGDVTKWRSFWDCFKAAVHSNQAISKIDMYNYLNSLLEGPAARAIQGLALTEANYNNAIELLQARFGKPQQVISAHMDELLRLPSCAGDKSSSLRYVYNKISVHVRGLEALGVSSKEYGSLLIPILMSELPNDLRMRIARESKDEVWKIDELIETLRVEIEVREASERFKIGERQKQGENPTRRVPQTTGSTLLSRESGEFKVNCAYCNALHYSASCQSVTDPAKRKEILSQAKRCFNCLQQGHGVKDCQSPGLCRNCGSRHHQSICSKGYTPRDSRERPNDNKDKVRSTRQPAESGNRVNYLPHHPVIRSDKDTTKVRVVYDGSAKNSKEEKSLNDCLEIGPNYTPHVFDTLVKFRGNSIGVTADIEKAFLMIGIKSSDRDALRFLWFDDPNECHTELTVYRFKRLVFGLRPSPAILGFTISHHLDQYLQSDSKLVSLLKESFYVDDLVTGEKSVEQSFHIYKRSKEIMEDGGFNLRK